MRADLEEQAGAVVPTVRGLPLVGSALDLRRDLPGAYVRAMQTHRDVARFVAGPPGLRLVLYVVFHPDGVQRVLATESARYRKGNRFYQELRAAIGDGLLTSQDERWRRQKRVIQPLFTHRRIESYVGIMVEEAEGMVRRWRERAAADEAVDLNSETTRLTLNVVGRALFGSDIDRIVPLMQVLTPLGSRHVTRRAFSPLPVPPTWPTPANRRFTKAQATVYGICDELIARRRDSGPESGPEDLLSLLLAARDPETGEALDAEEIRDQVLVFLLAGHDTTATALTFTLHLLGRHGDVQERVHRELEQVLGGAPPTPADVQALTYATMVIKEAMRLYPSAHVIGRQTPGGDRLLGYDIPPGSQVIVSPWATHRHPDFWEDPERFDPERFTPERERTRHRYAYLPFGGGPRACIGQYFSMVELVTTLAVVLQAYRLTSLTADVPMTSMVTIRPASAVPCQLAVRATAPAGATRKERASA